MLLVHEKVALVIIALDHYCHQEHKSGLYNYGLEVQNIVRSLCPLVIIMDKDAINI